MTQSQISLCPSFFAKNEKLLLESGTLRAYTFLFDSGVCGVKFQNELGEMVMLPFQGQQIWSVKFFGRELQMKTVCSMPLKNVSFLETFGGFLQHCGVSAMGAPGPEDKHPLHGEIPNAEYLNAWVIFGEDKKGKYIGLTGQYKNNAVFGNNYIAQPTVKLYSQSSMLDLNFKVENLKNTPMELMYMAHINYRSVIDGRLVYSAKPTPQKVRIRGTIPTHIQPKPGYAELLKELASNPEKHHLLSADFPADPELVLCIDYDADVDGWAHTMQVHPDGNADYVAHRPSQLPRATRWISRTPDHDSLAIVEPGTAEPEGYSVEKRKGNIVSLAAKSTFSCDIVMGAINREQTELIESKVKKILAN